MTPGETQKSREEYFCFGFLKRVKEIKNIFIHVLFPRPKGQGQYSSSSGPVQSSTSSPEPILPLRTEDNASTMSFWLTPQRLAVSFSHFLWQFTSHSVVVAGEKEEGLLTPDSHHLRVMNFRRYNKFHLSWCLRSSDPNCPSREETQHSSCNIKLFVIDSRTN